MNPATDYTNADLLALAEASHAAARKAQWDAKHAYEEELQREVERVRSEVAGRHAVRLAETSAARVQAERVLDACREAAANEASPFPPGTKMVREERTHVGWSTSSGYTTSLVHGLFEVVGADTRFAENLGRWTAPKIGDFIVRLLKKDGSPGMRFERYLLNLPEHSAHRQWKPVEEDPK